MNSIRQFPRSLLTATWKFSRRNSTSVADSFGQNVKVDNIQNSSQFFPWRQRPLNPRHRSPLNKFILSLLLSEIEPTPQFLQGAQAAFESAVYAIFHHPDLITHNKAIQFQQTSNPNEKSEVTPSDQSADILTINEVFEERLANFYTNAIKNVRLQPHYRVFHQIHSIRQPQITRSDLLLYSSVDKVEHEFLERINYPYGLGGRLKPQSKENVPGSKVHDNIDDDSYNIITNLKSKNHGGNEPDSVLLRVWVDVNSQEIFYIKDVERDVFIQGNDVSRSTTHEILLENTLRIEDIFQLKLEYTDEWKLVDIDQWIEHNDDWLQYRFSSK